jgi:hypothetical protein
MNFSNPFHIFDVSDTDTIKAFYRYQLFVEDELINETPIPIKGIQPRYVELFWTIKPSTNLNNLLGNRKLDELREAIIFEDSAQEQNVLTYKADSLRETVQQIKKIRTLLNVNETLSPQSSVQEITKKTPKELTLKFLEQYSKVENYGIKFAKNISEKAETENFTSLLTPIVKLTSAFAKDVLDTAAEDHINLKALEKAQEDGEVSLPSMFTDAARELIINSPVRARLGTLATEPIFEPVGYIIEKYRKTLEGFEKVKTFFITGANIGTLIDNEVKHEDVLFYTVQNVFYVDVPTKNEAGQDIVAGILIASKQISTNVLSCFEQKIPEPPRDFDIRWDHGTDKLLLNWSLPINPERDIKYIQVFRRSKIDEPFVLQVMFDFNNTILPPTKTSVLLEQEIEQTSIKKTSNFVGIWYDEEFTKQTKEQIYALCCVDAHGQSSFYSMQLGVRYSQQHGNVITRIISEKGAPKPYPNLLLNQDMFFDSIKDQGHTTLTIAFTPEYLDVVKDNGIEYNLLKTGVNDTYVLQVINIDSQKQETINIKLKKIET